MIILNVICKLYQNSSFRIQVWMSLLDQKGSWSAMEYAYAIKAIMHYY